MIGDLHWTSADLWSDNLRSYQDDDGGLAEEEEEVAQESAAANNVPVDWTRYVRREARLGVDVPRPLGHVALENEDLELRRYLSSPAAAPFQYWEIRLACSLSAAEGESFERATVRVRLRSPGHPQDPVAWSMAPDERLAPGTGMWHYKVGVDLKFLTTEASRDVSKQDAVVVKAHNRFSSEPWWAIGGKGQRLDGDYGLALIVRGPRDTPAEMHVAMKVTVAKMRRWRPSRTVTVKEPVHVERLLMTDAQWAELPDDEDE
jgi:hypothetical protein